MSQIHIVRPHALPLAEGKKILSELAQQLAKEYGAKYQLIDTQVKFQATGVEGQLMLDTQAVTITASLGFLMRPFKSQIEAQIHQKLDQILGRA